MTPSLITPALAGATMFARYLQADPGRRPVAQTLLGLLEDDGSLGDKARYYIVRSSFRRAVLRGTLIALAFKLPAWLLECPASADANKQFTTAFRDRYNKHRRQQRYHEAYPDVQRESS